MDPKIRSKYILETYNKISKLYSDKYDNDTKDNNLLDIFFSKIESPIANILDIGCGTGRTSAYLKNKNEKFSILGIDISIGMLEIARKNFPKIKFENNNILEFDAHSESFDAVVAQSSLFHFDKAELLILVNKVFNLLRPGGVFGLIMQTVEQYKCVSLPEPLMPESTMHLCFYSIKDLEEILISAGFKIIAKENNEIINSKISNYKTLIVGMK